MGPYFIASFIGILSYSLRFRLLTFVIAVNIFLENFQENNRRLHEFVKIARIPLSYAWEHIKLPANVQLPAI